jgi:hypothetical protein
MRQGDSKIREAIGAATGTSISRELIAQQDAMNCLFNARVDALSVELSPRRTGIRAFMVRFIIRAATAWAALSGAADNWYARVTGTGHLDS